MFVSLDILVFLLLLAGAFTGGYIFGLVTAFKEKKNKKDK